MTRGLTAALILMIAGPCSAMAAPSAPAARPYADATPHVVLVGALCGPGFRLNRFGACVPGRRFVGPAIVAPAVVAPVRLPPPCPRGYVRDPRPGVRLCYPRF